MTNSHSTEETQGSPRRQYLDRKRQREEEAGRLEGRHHALGYARLATAAAGIVLAWVILQEGILPGGVLLIPLAIFLLLSWMHDRVLLRESRLRRSAEYFQRGIDRIDGSWAGTGETGNEFNDPVHPFAEDLDLFGNGSLYQLLCSARTHAGQELLAGWLMASAAPEEIRARQEAVDELRSRLTLREDLAMLTAEAREGVDSQPLARWAARPPVLESRAFRVAAPLLAAATTTALTGWAFGGWSFIPAGILMVVQGIAGQVWRERVVDVVTAVERAARDLSLLSQVLARLEKESFSSPRLAQLRDTLETGGRSPSASIARLNRLVELLDSRRNQFFAPLSPLLLWATQLAFALESWRQRSGRAVGDWLRAVGEIEALSSLAGYAYEHPADPFPVLETNGPIFEGTGLGHPLISESECVRNDLRLDQGRTLLVVSGSNMSGKSTLLRSVGINAILALAGAPVRAGGLRISPLHLGASIRNVDSLQDGKSRFYAEITRLKQIMTMAGEDGTVMYLLDELLSGTNSHDRKIGAEAVVRGLVTRGALGLLTTHDLALTRIADAMGDGAANIHFEDRVEDGEIQFDYRLRQGVVEKGNALELMRAVGLEV